MKTKPFIPRPNRTAALMISLLALCLVSGCGVGTMLEDSWDYVSAPFTSSAGDSLTKRIVVTPFGSGIKDLQPRAKAWGDELVAGLKKQPGLSVYDAKNLPPVVRTVPLEVRDLGQRLIMAGRKLGINLLVSGRVTDLSVSHDLTGIYGFRENTPFLKMEGDMTMINVSTGVIIGMKSIVTTLEIDDVLAQGIIMGAKPPADMVDKLFKEAMEPSMEWIVETGEDQSWSGLVQKVEGNRVLVTGGKVNGIEKGWDLVIYGQGEKIKAGSGRTLHLMGPQVARIRLTEVMESTSWGEVLPESLTKPKPEEEPEDKPKQGADGKEKAEAPKEPEKPKQPQEPLIRPGLMVKVY